MNSILSFIFLVLLIVLGILYCFWGYRALKIVIFFYTLFATFTFLYNFMVGVAPDLGMGNFLIALIVGLVAGALTFFFVKFAIFVAGGIIGIVIFNIIRQFNAAYFERLEDLNVFLIAVVCFVIMGAITLALQKHLLIIFSAIFGGYSLVYFSGILIGVLFQPDVLATTTAANLTKQLAPYSIFTDLGSWAMYIPIVVFSILGMISQYRYTGRRKR